MEKLCLPAYIRTWFLVGLSATEIHNESTTAFEQGTVSYRTVAQWVNQLSSGRGL